MLEHICKYINEKIGKRIEIAIVTGSGLSSVKNILTNYRFILFISCVLEISHLIIPNRAFEFYDLIANFTGVVIILLLNSFIKWRKHF